MPDVLKIMEVDESGTSSGRLFEFSEVDFFPLGYRDLKNAKLAQPITIPLEGSGTLIAAHGFDTASPIQHGQFRATLESHFSSRAIGLVRGGWLPSALALKNDTIVMPDRCVIAQINARLLNGAPRSGGGTDFVDLFADTAVRINPLLFVVEGDTRRNPTVEEARIHLAEAVGKLRSALPKAILVAADDVGLKGVLGLIEDSTFSMRRKQDFLMRIAPSLAAPVGRKSISARWNEILTVANDFQLPQLSLVVLAALSTVVMPNGTSPARRLLKFSQNYTKEDAYNALADLRSLDILIYVLALFPAQRTMLCTADRDLALFWAGLSPSNLEFRNGRVFFDINPDELLPKMTKEMWQSITGN